MHCKAVVLTDILQVACSALENSPSVITMTAAVTNIQLEEGLLLMANNGQLTASRLNSQQIALPSRA